MTGRILAVDLGARRVGLAISDSSSTLARPLETIAVTSDADAVDRVARRIDELAREDDGLAAIVVGMPAALDGTATPESARAAAFIASLAKRTPLPRAASFFMFGSLPSSIHFWTSRGSMPSKPRITSFC